MINEQWLHKTEDSARRQNRETISALMNRLANLLDELDSEPEIKPNKNREVIRSEKRGSMTVQFEKVNCGKATCKKCKSGPAHGPYWYGYWKEGGKTRSKYIGKTLKPAGEGRESAPEGSDPGITPSV